MTKIIDPASLPGFHLDSRRRGGQWAGPCYFTGQGQDHFVIEPHPPGGKPRWFCRACNWSCRHGRASRDGAYRWGDFADEDEAAITHSRRKLKPMTNASITLDAVAKMSESLNGEGVAYLESRGITLDTARYFRLGMLNGKFITIPKLFTWKGKLQVDAIKQRWLDQYRPANRPKYLALPGSSTKGIFNFDVLSKPAVFGIVANSLFDVMLLHQLGYPVVGPFSGEADWEEKWSRYIQWEVVLNMGDWDPEAKRTVKGQEEVYRPGTEYMLKRALKLDAPHIQQIINVHPPDGITDIAAMAEVGMDVSKWISQIVQEAMSHA
jgi:hypothetical protein